MKKSFGTLKTRKVEDNCGNVIMKEESIPREHKLNEERDKQMKPRLKPRRFSTFAR